MDGGEPDDEVLFEEEVWEVEEDEEDADRPSGEELQAEMEAMDLEEEDEEEASEKTDAVTTFRKHEGSVYSVSLHPREPLVCSGGGDDRGFLWDLNDGSVALECKGHSDSVTCTGFSHDGKYLATGDMAGGVRVWSVEDRQPVCAFESSDLEWMKWHPQAHVLLAGTEDGMGWMWKIPGGDCKTFIAQNCRNICSAFFPDGKTIVCGYADGGVRVWNLKECTTTCTMSPVHQGPVNCIAVSSDGSLVITGSEDDTARLVNSATGKVVVSLAAGNPPSSGPSLSNSETEEDKSQVNSSVEDVVFCPTLPLILTASLSGAVCVWDIATQKLRHCLKHQEGVVKVECSRRGDPVVFTGCLDGHVRMWDIRSGDCVRQWLGHRDILDLSISSDDSIIVSASDDAAVLTFYNKSPT